MPTSSRPNPDQLLEHVQREETRQKRGKFKIFLGYAAGVGKTFAMLEAARQLRAEGLDVVAAYVETHKRAETEAMLTGLEIMPRQEIEYRGVSIPEMDLDAVIARRPQIALVDELAHTNAPGSRHDKRYQDIQELLEAGIGVHTTLNIQHLESLNDVVAQITGVIVRETVPDWVLDEADEIELIDLPPAELRQRLDEGKVYVPDQAARAIRKFFRAGNLTALREMALRATADRVDAQMRAYMQTHAIAGPWPAGERLLVCIGQNPLSERLVRTARRLADRLNAEWFAVYVELPDQIWVTDADRDRITQVLRLAEELGGKNLILPGNSVPEAVLTYAHANNITKIVAGKPIHTGWMSLGRRSIVDQIIRYSGHIDVYVISAEPGDEEKVEFSLPSPLLQHRWKRWLQSTLLIIAVTLLGLPLRGVIEPTNLVMLYLIAVVMAGVWWGRSPAILASVLGVVAFDLIFIPPYYQFAVSDAEYILTFIAFLGTGFVTGNLASRVREQVRTALRREAQTAAQYELSRALANAADLSRIGEAVVTHTEKLLSGPVVLFIHENNGLRPLATSKGLNLTEHEQAVATWAYERGQPAGHGTDTLTGADGLYLPLQTSQEVVGILGVFPEDRHILPDQNRLLESFASQTALALERVQFAERAKHAQLLQETEKLQTALLNSISHDLRTPLASITGALSTLREEAPFLDDAARQDLLTTAAEESDRLNRLVGNLLDMTRLESGALRIALKPGDLQDVIGVALSQLGSRLRHREIKLNLPADLPLIPMDFVLIVQVMVNLLDNADKYSPPEKPISVRAVVSQREVLVEVADRGSGIPEAEQERIFDKFYRVRQPTGAGGTGLGLSISKGIVEAHGGRIWAQNRGGGCPVHLRPPPRDPAKGGRTMIERGSSVSAGIVIVVVDDERAIRRFLSTALTAHGHTIHEASNGQEALAAVVQHRPDLVILDLGLPDMDGIEVTRRLREWTQIPIIILSVREQETDKIAALDAGADDYLTKPFYAGELMARIRAALRRAVRPETTTIFTEGGLTVDFARRLVTVEGTEVKLTPTEYDLLRVLVTHAGKVLTHQQLLRQVWGTGYESDYHMLRVNVSNLRHKIEPDAARPRYILTEPGVGYRLQME